MAGSQGGGGGGFDPMAFPQSLGGMPIEMQPVQSPTLATRPGFRPPPKSPGVGLRPGGFEKPMPGTGLGSGLGSGMNLDQWGQLLPPRLQAQIAQGLPLEEAVGRFRGQLMGDPNMPAWQNPEIKRLMGETPQQGGPYPAIRPLPLRPENFGHRGEMDQPQAYPMPVGSPVPESGPAQPNLLEQALARQARPRFDQGVRGGGYDWKADRDRALGQGAFAPKPEIMTPIDPVATKPKPAGSDDLNGKPPIFTKPMPKSGRRLPGGY